MRYENVNCTACGELFTAADDVVVCPVCGAPHHRDCWQRTGCCAMQNEHENGYTWVFPANAQKTDPEPARAPEARPEQDGIKLRNGEAVVECPHCGSPNYGNDIYCLRCGARLDGQTPEREQPPMGGAEDYRQDMNQFREIRYDFDRFGGISPDAMVDGIPCAEYSDYVGGSRPGRIIRKVSTMERYGRKLSWSWSALLLGPLWFFWRRMKKEGLIISIVLLFFAAMYGVVQIDGPLVSYYKDSFAAIADAVRNGYDMNELREKIDGFTDTYYAEESAVLTPGRSAALAVLEYSVFIGVPLASALLAIPLYRKKVKNHILDIRGDCTNMYEYRDALISRGGTSAGGAAAGAAVLLAAAFCLFFLPMVIVLAFM